MRRENLETLATSKTYGDLHDKRYSYSLDIYNIGIRESEAHNTTPVLRGERFMPFTLQRLWVRAL